MRLLLLLYIPVKSMKSVRKMNLISRNEFNHCFVSEETASFDAWGETNCAEWYRRSITEDDWESTSEWLTEEENPVLGQLVFEFKDIWRTKLGNDPPANVIPYRLYLKSDAVPYRAKAEECLHHIVIFPENCVTSWEEWICTKKSK